MVFVPACGFVLVYCFLIGVVCAFCVLFLVFWFVIKNSVSSNFAFLFVDFYSSVTKVFFPFFFFLVETND